jgi:hypothetical protein
MFAVPRAGLCSRPNHDSYKNSPVMGEFLIVHPGQDQVSEAKYSLQTHKILEEK